jgi:hypothetical protein
VRYFDAELDAWANGILAARERWISWEYLPHDDELAEPIWSFSRVDTSEWRRREEAQIARIKMTEQLLCTNSKSPSQSTPDELNARAAGSRVG